MTLAIVVTPVFRVAILHYSVRSRDTVFKHIAGILHRRYMFTRGAHCMLHACFFDECLPADLHNSAPFEPEVKLHL